MKNIFTLLFIVYAGLASSQSLLSGLKACYPFNGNAQNFAPTGPALNGAVSNVFNTTGHTGVANTAYRLTGNVGSYIELPDHPGLKNDSVFFSGWFRIDSLPPSQNLSGLQYLVYTTNGCLSNFEAYSLDTHYEPQIGHVFRVSKCGSDCGLKPQINSLNAISTGSWYHICFFITNAVMKLYVNGVLQSSTPHNVMFGYQPGFNVYLGVTNQSNFNLPFKGAVDDVRFYKRELSLQEINQLLHNPGCSDIIDATSEMVWSAAKIKVHPNPATDQVSIEGLNENTLIVYDVLGRSVKYNKTMTSENECDIVLQDASPGTYFLNIVSPQGNFQRSIKLIIIK